MNIKEITPQALAKGWTEYYDDIHERPYYHNSETDETQWERPGDASVPQDADSNLGPLILPVTI